MSAVGALPTAKRSGPGSAEALSIDATARVVPMSFAPAATSGSDMKQRTSPPNRAREVLLIPARAICVSVTTAAPARSAARAVSTTPGEKTRLSA